MKYYIVLVCVITFEVIGLQKTYSQTFDEIVKIVASDENVSDNFGNSVSISGEYAVVGAKLEDDDVDGNSSYKYTSSGSAYIYQRNDAEDSWEQVQKIVASDRAAGDQFGNAVAMSGDYAVIGAYRQTLDEDGENSLSNAGAVYVFKRNSDDTWSQTQKLVASYRSADSYFGYSVAICGSFIIVGSYTDNTDENGENSLNYAGSAYVFKYNSTADSWEEQQKLAASTRSASDFFGYAVSITDNFAVVTANSEDEDENEENTLSSAGSAYVFEYNETEESWTQVQKLVASDREVDDYFGSAVSIDENYIVVGAYNESEDASGSETLTSAGSAYVFEYNETDESWSQVQKVVASDRAASDYFGSSVGISGEFVVVGAYAEDEDANSSNTLDGAGSAYCFLRKSDGTWEEVNKIVPSNRYSGDYFGCSVAISDSTVISGAYSNDYDATESVRIKNSGAAYLFKYTDATTDIDNAIQSDDVLVYPNPATDKIYIEQKVLSTEDCYAYFYDITGQLKKKSPLSYGKNLIYVNDLPKGIYIVKVNLNVFKINLK